MKIQFICMGKTSFAYLNEGILLYQKRLQHYVPFEQIVLPDIKKGKSWSAEQIRNEEGERLLKAIGKEAMVVLLDVKGKAFSSEEFAEFIHTQMLAATKTVCFIIGGAYGFSAQMYARAQCKISLSKMTFSHQLVRVVFLEQLYRAMTILKREPYHH